MAFFVLELILNFGGFVFSLFPRASVKDYRDDKFAVLGQLSPLVEDSSAPWWAARGDQSWRLLTRTVLGRCGGLWDWLGPGPWNAILGGSWQNSFDARIGGGVCARYFGSTKMTAAWTVTRDSCKTQLLRPKRKKSNNPLPCNSLCQGENWKKSICIARASHVLPKLIRLVFLFVF